MKRIMILFGCLLIAGCAKSPRDVAYDYTSKWSRMGMYLPDEPEIEFFRSNFMEVRGVIAEKLKAGNPDVRMRAAYLIDKLGNTAFSLRSETFKALKSEQESLPRIYLCNAIRSLNAKESEIIEYLRQYYDSLMAFDGKSEDERIYFAAALVVLTDYRDESSDCYKYLLSWLKPPGSSLSTVELDRYWEMRWSAVNALEGMKQAKEAVPFLESMLREDAKKGRVEAHVPRVIQSIEK
ncbi:MAG: hypothetical protein ACYS8Y_14660 [Planctomycetota bacterium]|jgi:hypothetical protein